MISTKIEQRDAQFSVAIALSLGIVGQLSLFAWIIWVLAPFIDQVSTFPITISNTAILVTLIVTNPVYCIVASSFIRPKRRVSPFLIHMGTFSLIVVLLVYGVVIESWYRSYFALHITSHVLLVCSSLFSYLFLLGFVQTKIVYWVIGLNPPTDRLDQKTYRVPARSADVLRIITTAMIDGLRKVDDNIFEIRRGYGKRLIIAVNGSEAKPCLVSMVPYQVTSTLTSTRATSELRNSIVNDLERRLSEDYKKPLKFQVLKSTDDSFSMDTMAVALRPVQSKINSLMVVWSRVPRSYKFATAVSLAIFFVTLGLFLAHIVTDVGSVASILVLVALVLLMELGLPLRQELIERSRNVRELSP